MAPQSNASNSSTDSLLAQAFEESVRLQRHREHTERERELQERQREEEVLAESRRTFVDRVREEENAEEEQLRLAMERSAADEQERAARRQREREERLRLDREFGSGGSRRPRRRESQGERRGRDGGRQETAPAPAPESAPAPAWSATTSSHSDYHTPHASPFRNTNSSFPLSPPLENPPQDEPPLRCRRLRTRNETDGINNGHMVEEDSQNRHYGHDLQSRANPTPGLGRFHAPRSRIEELSQGPQRPIDQAHEVIQSNSHFEHPISRRNTTSSHRSGFGPGEDGGRMHTGLPPRRTNSDTPEFGAPYGVQGSHSGPHYVHYHRHHHHNSTGWDGHRPRLDPSAYSLSEIMARSRTDAYPTEAPFTEEGQEFNHHELQAAINASAEQGRDPDEEAVQRNMDCPTYEEACAMRRYKPRRGDRYVFQGPNVVEIEGNKDANQPGVRMEIVGEMDLAEAMRVANRGRNRNRRQNAAG